MIDICEIDHHEKTKRYYRCFGVSQKVLHRENDLPAVVYENGTRMWYKMDNLHRDDDKPAIEDPNKGETHWLKNGRYHRDNDKPAIITKNSIFWYSKGYEHRDFGLPAVIKFHQAIIEWYWRGFECRDQREAFTRALDFRKRAFGLFIILFKNEIPEDDLFTIMKLTWVDKDDHAHNLTKCREDAGWNILSMEGGFLV